MSNLREAYAGTAMAGLGWSDIAERPVDRVAATGFADSLGTTLWRAKYQGSSSAVILALLGLRDLFQARYRSESIDMVRRITAQCLLEYLSPACEVCDGRGEMELDNGVKIVCKACSGAKIRRYSDRDRAQSMQISPAMAKAIDHKLAWMAREIQRLDAGVNIVMSAQLERAA